MSKDYKSGHFVYKTVKLSFVQAIRYNRTTNLKSKKRCKIFLHFRINIFDSLLCAELTVF